DQDIGAHDPVVFAYQIVNAGHKSNEEVEKAVRAGTGELLKKGAELLKAKQGNIWVELAKFISTVVLGLLFADCDGPVAADQIQSTYDELSKKIPKPAESK